MVVYMDIVAFLRPRFFLMENVVDILKFCDGTLASYALARAVGMNYQSKFGIMVAGCYGMPQFRARCFLWGASSEEILPPHPMPTHKVIVRAAIFKKWEPCLVAYEENKLPEWLQKPLVLEDALSDLPAVGNDEKKEEIPYEKGPQCDFQHFVRLPKKGIGGLGTLGQRKKGTLSDHRALCLNADDLQRVQQIPKKKVLDTFVQGRSLKPFGRLWWDETVPAVVTRAEPHNQIIIHPLQDRVLTIRENARLQGFPDYYRLHGPVKQRHMQVGNAVAVPVASALGYALGQAFLREVSPRQDTLELPQHFPYCYTLDT